MVYLLRVLCVTTLLGALSSSAWAMKPVLVLSSDNAAVNGVLRGVGGNCFVVIPSAGRRDEGLSVVARDGSKIAIKRVSSLSPELGLYLAEKSPAFLCMDLWPNAERVNLLLQMGRSTWLDAPLVDQASQEVKVELDEFDEQLLLSVDGDQAPEGRHLGSLVRIRFSPVGMVVGFDPDFGVAHAVRMDELTQQLDEYFRDNIGGQLASESVVEVTPLSEPQHKKVIQKTKLRRDPAETAKSVRILREGWEVDVIGKVVDRPWYEVSYFGLSGFVPVEALR